MDTNTKVEEKSEVKAKGGRDVKKRPEAKKPGKAAESAPEGRGRAKSTLVNPFNNKKTPAGKKDVKPVETIGQDRFKNLLSMFEKPDKDKENKEDTGPKKLDMSRFSAFSKTNESTASNDVNSGDNKGSVSEGIQKRMQALLNNNKTGAANNKGLDPVLEQRKKMREDQEESNDDKDFDEDDDDFNDHLSDDKDAEAKDDLDDSFSDSSEKPKKEEKDDSEDEDKDDEKDHSVEEKVEEKTEEKADESDKDQNENENENEDVKSQHSEHIEKEIVTELNQDDKEIISSTEENEKADNKTSVEVEAKAKTEAETIPQTEQNEEKTTQDA